MKLSWHSVESYPPERRYSITLFRREGMGVFSCWFRFGFKRWALLIRTKWSEA